MDDRYVDIQTRYLAEMRGVLEVVLAWWTARSVTPVEGLPPAGLNDFDRRWPAGPVAHPHVLEVFRRHFLEADDLNLENEARRRGDGRPLRTLWGEPEDPGALAFVRPIDLLVNDLEHKAPDVYAVMQGLVFVPIGLNPEEEFC